MKKHNGKPSSGWNNKLIMLHTKSFKNGDIHQIAKGVCFRLLSICNSPTFSFCQKPSTCWIYLHGSGALHTVPQVVEGVVAFQPEIFPRALRGFFGWYLLPETKGKQQCFPSKMMVGRFGGWSIFRGELAVSFREGK